jgi:hypothetical protein
MDPKVSETVRMGYELGYQQPDAEPGIPLDEPWMSYYRQGMDAGRQERAEADAQYGGPAVGPDLGGESWEHYQKRLDELIEAVTEKQEPHTETEEPKIEPEVELAP